MGGVVVSVAEDILDRYPIEQDPIYGCWLWIGDLDADGYGRRWQGKIKELAHHLVWKKLRAAIAPGYTLDHLCRRRACVAPHHLEPVTRRENERRKRLGYRTRITSCAHGHALYNHGRYTPEGGRVCLICSGIREPT